MHWTEACQSLMLHFSNKLNTAQCHISAIKLNTAQCHASASIHTSQCHPMHRNKSYHMVRMSGGEGSALT